MCLHKRSTITKLIVSKMKRKCKKKHETIIIEKVVKKKHKSVMIKLEINI